MPAIERIHARQILDSRGNPTVEVEVELDTGASGRAAVPSGASTGEFEATELRDGGTEWAGKGVSRAVANVNDEIARALTGARATEQGAIDRTLIDLDGTPNKARLGANAILGVSLAVAKAAAAEAGEPLYLFLGGTGETTLPVPMMNVLNGGAHADNDIDFQEFMVVPAGASTFADGLRMGVEVFHALKSTLKSQGLGTTVGDEGGFAPDLDSNEAALEVLIAGIEAAGYEPGKHAYIALDPATSELHQGDAYVLEHEGRSLSASELIDYWDDVCEAVSGGVDRGRHGGGGLGRLADAHRAARRPHPARGRRPVRDQRRAPERGIEEGVGNSMLVKLNQIGTLTRDAGDDRHRQRRGLHDRDLPSLGRDGGHDDRGHRGGDRRRPDQDRRPVALRSRGEVQPAAPHLRGARGDGRVTPGSARSPEGRASALANHEA